MWKYKIRPTLTRPMDRAKVNRICRTRLGNNIESSNETLTSFNTRIVLLLNDLCLYGSRPSEKVVKRAATKNRA